MNLNKNISHKFVEFIPEKIEDGIVYISVEYATAVHKCCCGCGEKVITPISPTDWQLSFDGISVSLHPSIGNWGFNCKSHYWIKNNKIVWSGQWSSQQIENGRICDKRLKEQYFNSSLISDDIEKKLETSDERKGLLSRFKNWF